MVGHKSFPTDESVTQLAQQVRESFYRISGRRDKIDRHDPRYDGGIDRFGRKCSDIWKQIASKLIYSNITDVPGYIRFVKSQSRHFYPNTLLSDELITKFKKYRENLYPQILNELENDKIEFLRAYKYWFIIKENREEALRASLRDSSASISAFFRYLMASKLGLHEIAKEYAAEAEKQRRMFPEIYSRIEKEFLDAREGAEHLHQP